MQMLRDNSKLVNVDDTISLFWNIYVIDALLGNFDMKKIDTLLDKTIFISETQKEFYRHMIWARYQVILRQSYERLMNGNMI